MACPSSFHEFEGPEPIPYDVEGRFISASLLLTEQPEFVCMPGTDRGNRYKVEKELSAYDEDATLAVDLLTNLPICNGRIAGKHIDCVKQIYLSNLFITATGMCLGGHLVSLKPVENYIKISIPRYFQAFRVNIPPH